MKKYSSEDKRSYFKAQMDQLKGTIEDKIHSFLENSEELKKFIDFRRQHFHSYSLNNSVLIYKQCPEASYVAGYNKWKSLGYSVRKGEKGLSILIPLIKNTEDEKTSTEKKVIYGFKKGIVFDLSQVEATEEAVELPNIDISIKETDNTLYDSKELLYGTRAFIEQHCPVIESRDLDRAMGMTDGKNIYVKATDNFVDMAGVLVHEFAHFLNHYKENRYKLTKNLKESEAELCTLIFGSYFNLDINGAYKYLSMYRKERDIGQCFETAYRTFEYIIDGSENKRGLESILGGHKIEG
jgi:hypothetical protein